MNLKKFSVFLLTVFLFTSVQIKPLSADTLCYRAISKLVGTKVRTKLRTRMVGVGESCPKRFKELINTDTLAGPKGDQGEQGEKGGFSGIEIVTTSQSVMYADGSSQVVNASCPSGKRIIASGCFSADSRLILSSVVPVDAVTPNLTQCFYRNSSGGPITSETRAYATCVDE